MKGQKLMKRNRFELECKILEHKIQVCDEAITSLEKMLEEFEGAANDQKFLDVLNECKKTKKVLESFGSGSPAADSYEIVFVKNGETIYSEEVDYDEIYEALRRYHCMSDVLEILK